MVIGALMITGYLTVNSFVVLWLMLGHFQFILFGAFFNQYRSLDCCKLLSGKVFQQLLLCYHRTYTLLITEYFNVNKNPTDATVCRYLFTVKLLYIFRVSQHPSSGVLKTVPAASGTGHATCTATPLHTALEGSSGTSSMTCTGGCGYSS